MGSWPNSKVAAYAGGEAWHEIGRVGEDGTEVNGLVVYNGKLYGGSLPRAEVCRYDGDSKWTSLPRFFSPDGWQPGVPYNSTREQVNEWVRLNSLTIFDGKLFASTGSCTSSVLDAPCDVRGKVFSMEAGKCASYDDDPWVRKRIEILDQDAQLIDCIYGVLNEAAGYKADRSEARKDRIRALMACVGANEVVMKDDIRGNILKSLLPHVRSVLGPDEAAKYDRVIVLPTE